MTDHSRKLVEKFFLVLTPSAITVYSYDGRKVSQPRFHGLRTESLSASSLSLAADCVAVIDPSNKGALVGRAAGVVDAVAGGACVAPEFFKSWLSRPGADLGSHVLHGSLESGKLAASIRASLGGCGPAPPAPNARGASILTLSLIHI